MTETTTGTKREGAAESSLLRMLAVIELFSIDKPRWTVEQVARALNLTHSTAYRYVAALCSYGYLAPLGGAEYSLGPKIIELDLIIRETDPIVARAETHAVQL